MVSARQDKQQTLYWLIAILAGSLVNGLLFLVLPALGRSEPPPPVPVITLNFMQWQEPVKAAPEQKKITPPKPKTKPVVKQAPPTEEKKPEPLPEKTPEPVLSENEQPPSPTPVPLAPQKTEPVEEALPTPVPLFEITTMPRFIHKVEPEYPPLMRSLNREGKVKLKVLIDEKGKVRKVYIAQSLGDEFDKAAVDAMMRSTFEPGNQNGKAVTVLLVITINFKLN